MSLTVSNTPPKLFPISFNLMTEWIWQPSSWRAPLLRLLPIWDACLSAVRGLLAAVFIWLWGQYTQGLDTQRERLSAKCFWWWRGERALMSRDSLRGRNALAWGRTDLVMSKWGRLFRRHECIRVCLSGQHGSQNMCLCVWSIWYSFSNLINYEHGGETLLIHPMPGNCLGNTTCTTFIKATRGTQPGSWGSQKHPDRVSVGYSCLYFSQNKLLISQDATLTYRTI